MWTRTDIAEQIFALETQLHPEKMTLAGIAFWELIRIEMFRMICREHNLGSQASKKKRETALNDTREPYKKNRTLPNKKFKYLFLGRPAERRIKFEKTLWIPETDPVIEKLGEEDCITLERSFNGTSLSDECVRSLNIERMNILNSFPRRAFVKLKMMNLTSRAELSRINDLSTIINKRFYVDIDLLKISISRVRAFLLSQIYYQSLIKRRKPEIIFITGGYSQSSMISAAQTFQIPVVELQHGVINKYHLGYSFPPCVTRTYKPSYLFLYGPFWRRNISFDIANDNVFEVGSCWHDKIKDKYKCDERTKSIVVVSSPANRDKITEIVKCIAMRAPRGWVIFVKPHPIEMPDAYKYYDELSNFENVRMIYEGSELLNVLGSAAIQIGVSSSALYEGSMLGCKTLVLNETGSEYMEGLITDGHAKLIESGTDVLREIELYNELGSDMYADNSAIYCHDPGARLLSAIDAVRRTAI